MLLYGNENGENKMAFVVPGGRPKSSWEVKEDIAHLDRHLESPLIKNVLLEKT